MRTMLGVIFLLLSGCVHVVETNPTAHDTTVSRTLKYQQEIDTALAEDAENKKWERIYLEEIAIAQEHDDHDAYKFFIVEYIKLPRMNLPDWMKEEPGYIPPVSAAEVIRARIKVIIQPVK